MARKKPGSLSQMFGRPGRSNLLDVPELSAPPAQRPPSAPEPAGVAATEEAAPAPPLAESSTELLPRTAQPQTLLSAPAPLQRSCAHPRTELPLPRPRPRRDELPRPEARMSPEEKGQLLLRYLRVGAPIKGLPFFDASLTKARLRGASLHGARLQRVDLSGADLRGADLQGADLRGANLTDASLVGVDLRRSQLARARLTRASLRTADLRNLKLGDVADMTGADLSGADLNGVEIVPALRGALVNAQTYFTSQWSALQLAAASACGIQIGGQDRLPLRDRLEVFGVQEGLVLTFTTPLSFQDRYVMRGAICAVLGPDAEVTLSELPEPDHMRVLITGERNADLTDVAETINGRSWEREPTSDGERTLLQRLFEVFPSAQLINELSSLVDRIEHIELHSRGSAMRWRPPVDPQAALQHLLLKLFIPVELRWWLACVPGGKQLVRALPSPDSPAELIVAAAIRALDSQHRINTSLFTSLIEERRRREREIRAVARLWGLEWYAVRDSGRMGLPRS